MKITITIDTDSDAFQSNPNELRSLLSAAATKVNAFGHAAHGKALMDSNGNKVGDIKIKERKAGTKPVKIIM